MTVNANVTALTDVQQAIRDVISAHEAIVKGIATHAEKRRALQQEMRHEAERQLAISEGAKRQNAQV